MLNLTVSWLAKTANSSSKEDKEKLFINEKRIFSKIMATTTTKKMTTMMSTTTMDVCTVTKKLKTCLGSVSSMTMTIITIMMVIPITQTMTTMMKIIPTVVGTFKSGVTIVEDIFATVATGVMNSKRIMRYVFVIDVMLFIVADVMKWTNVMIVVRSFVDHVQLY